MAQLLVREHQEWVARTVPGAGMVAVSDCVADVKNIHPTDKQKCRTTSGEYGIGQDIRPARFRI